MKNVLRSNIVLIVFYMFYLIILYSIFKDSFIGILIIHLIFIFIALTPIGESIMWLLNHTKKIVLKAKKIVLKEDREYLYSLFDEVYEQAKKENPRLSSNIKLFMNEEQMPNAFACASNTVCITKGAIQTFSREELQGIIAHELGHISSGDTKISMIFCIGNVLFMGFALIVKLFYITIFAVLKNRLDNSFVLTIINGIKNLIIRFLGFIVNAIFSLNSRNCGRGADEFAYTIGFGEELTQALYLLKQIDTSSNLSIMERIYAPHPDLDNRIARLEELGS